MSLNSNTLHPAGMDEAACSALYSRALLALLRDSKDIVIVKDTQFRYMAVSPAALEMLGKSSLDEVIGKRPEDLISDPDMVQRYLHDDRQILSSKQDLLDFVQAIPGEGDQMRYASTSKYVLTDDHGEAIGVLAVMKDVTREHLIQQHQEQTLQMLFSMPKNAYSVYYIDVEEWRLLDHRTQPVRGGSLIPCETVEDVQQIALESIVDSFCEAASFYRSFDSHQLQLSYQKGQAFRTLQAKVRLPDGEIRWVRSEIRFLVDVKSGHLCVTISTVDIEEEKRTEEKLILAAQMDQMTMTLNRSTTLQRIREILATEREKQHAFLIVDIDNFKQLNDSFGHQAGDACLIKAAELLHMNFRTEDVLGRIGGDEFFILMRNISSREMVTARVERMMQSFRRIGREYPGVALSVSVGIALFPACGDTVDELYEKADDALYRGKKGGKDQYVIAAGKTTAAAAKGGDTPMTLREFYGAVGGDYEDVIDRLHSEDIVLHFLQRFISDPIFDELQAAIDSGDQQKAFTIIHTFKGTCINMGLGNLTLVAQKLTESLRSAIMADVPALLEELRQAYKTVADGVKEQA